MAAFRRGKVYYIEPTVPGVGRLPRMSTTQRNQRVAEDMEAALRELALTGFKDLVVQLRDGHVQLIELWQAKLEGREALERLRTRRADPPLADAIAQRKPAVTDERVRTGYDQLVKFVPLAEKRLSEELQRAPLVPVRLSWLLEPIHVSTLYEVAIESKLRPNTVRRGLHRAVADMITRRYSRGRMLAVMADAGTPGENDERVVMLSPDEIVKVFDKADVQLQRAFGLAITTGIDRGPMLADRVSDYDEANGTLMVRDTKTAARPRVLLLRDEPVLQNAEYWLRQLVAGRAADAPLVDLGVHALRDRWEAVREAIGREDVRWKDLRGVFATYYLMAGGDPRNLQQILGHAAMTMVLRYLRRLPAGNRDQLKEVARAIGLPGGRSHLKVVGGM